MVTRRAAEPGTTWAGTHTYAAANLYTPDTLDEARRIVAGSTHIRALGSRHSFHDLADSPGDLISMDRLDPDLRIDAEARTVTFGAAVRYGDLATALDEAGWALGAMASLPHISVAGATATATHGSGDRTGNLASAVVALELITADGELLTLRRGDPDFPGAVVHLGALGVVTRITLALEPRYQVRQWVRREVPWEDLLGDFDAITSAAQSVSVFTRFAEIAGRVWMKSREETEPDVPWGVRAAVEQHPIDGLDPVNCTDQLGRPGPWYDRLPHFRMGFTPSVGAEIQSEYLVPRAHAVAAITAMRGLDEQLAPVLQVSEIRTIAGDDLWLSSTEGGDRVAFHLTFAREPDAVRALLPRIEDALDPFDARPHWGKWFTTSPERLAALYPRLGDFVDLAGRLDPHGCFRNDYLDRTVLPR
ncbi:FAD-binding protein [Occultella glacieicola]|uniref:FAD-binding protein n=1 Tax=Occultella glacieicola TaxID=2518684 RepID=A0ABY2EB92_9MICO|nr:FAD-binding protein [Occultella glacieicola]TDE97499.1 FAD-binding protein [Occultella glacieicola]